MKKKSSISDQTLKFINQKQLKPIPKWEFVTRNWAIWFGLVISFFILVLGAGLSWFGLVDNVITPYLWLIIVVVFLGISFLLFENTKKAYRFPKWQVISIIIFLGLVLGGVLFKIGLANQIDKKLEITLPHYRQMVPMKLRVWSNPQAGYLSGQITGFNSTGFTLLDFDGTNWNITSQNPLVRGRVRLEIDTQIKLIGTKTGDNSFAVREIRPWDGQMSPINLKEKP